MLNATRMNLINSIALIGMGLWGYLELDSPTALIPVGFGVVLLLCYNGVKNQNKISVFLLSFFSIFQNCDHTLKYTAELADLAL